MVVVVTLVTQIFQEKGIITMLKGQPKTAPISPLGKHIIINF